MARMEYSITIDRPVSEVFRYISDFAKYPQWQPDVISVHQSEGKTHVGTMVTQIRNLRVVFYKLDLNADVIDYQLNKLVEYKGTTGFFPITGSYTLEPQGRSTRLTEIMDIRMWGPHRLLGGFMVSAMKRRMEKTLTNLKQLVESDQGS